MIEKFKQTEAEILAMCEYYWEIIGKLNAIIPGKNLENVGVYKAIINTELKYIGVEKEYNNGGLAKRLRDYTRSSNSARKSNSGILMHGNAHIIDIYIIKTG